MPSLIPVPVAKKARRERARENFHIQSHLARILTRNSRDCMVQVQCHEVTNTVDHTFPKPSGLPPQVRWVWGEVFRNITYDTTQRVVSWSDLIGNLQSTRTGAGRIPVSMQKGMKVHNASLAPPVPVRSRDTVVETSGLKILDPLISCISRLTFACPPKVRYHPLTVALLQTPKLQRMDMTFI